MKILFMGGHELGAITLDKLVKEGFDVVGVVISKTDDKWYSGVDKVAYKYNLPLYEEENINSKKFLNKIRKESIDLIVSSNFNQILKKEIINLPKRGCINMHASLLPKYRGRAPINWAMINGEKETGVTVHFLEEGIDTGNIIIQEKIKIEDDDYIEDVLEKVKEKYPLVLIKAINLLQDYDFKGKEQDLQKGSYYGKREAKDGKINLDKSGKEILNLIKAVSRPYPGAYIIENNSKIIIWRASLSYEDNLNYNIGDMIIDNNKLSIKLKDSNLVIEDYSKEEYNND